MISSYISYLRLINDKLIRNGINLGVTLKDDMSVDELEDAKATLESYCYFNDVLTLCDSAYALDLVDGCRVKLYTDLVKEEVYEKYNEKFEMASNLLQSGMDNPLDEVKEPRSLSGYLSSLGKSSVRDLAVSVSAEEPKKVSVENLGDLFNISNEPKFDYVEDDLDEDEEFDYSDDNEGEDAEEQEEISENEEDDDSNVFFDFRNQSDEDEEPDEEEFDYSDDSEVFDNAEELPLTDDEDEESDEFNYSDDTDEASDSDDEENFNYSDDEAGSDTSEDDEEFDYSDDTDTEDSESSDEDFNYSDDEYEEEPEEASDNEEPSDGYSEDDEEFDYSDDDNSSEDEGEDFDYSDDKESSDGYSEDDEDIDYSDDNDDSEEDIDYSDDNEYEEDYDEEMSGYDEEPMFNVGASSHAQTAPKPKEAYEKDAELIEGIVDGGAKLLKSVGNKVRHSLFNGKK